MTSTGLISVEEYLRLTTKPNCEYRDGVLYPKALATTSHGVLQFTVAIMLQNEDRSGVVMTWRLLRAWPAKYTGPHLNGKGTDVAIETLELAFERLELE